MKKEIFQAILIIAACILFCLSGCSPGKKLEAKKYVVSWRQGDYIKFHGLHRLYSMPAELNIKVGDTLHMLPQSHFTPARF